VNESPAEPIVASVIARGAGVTVVRTLLLQVVSAITTLALARLLSPNHYGWYTTVMAAEAIAVQVCTGGLTLVMMRRLDLDDEVLNSMFWGLEALMTTLGALLVVAAYLLVAGPARATLLLFAGYLLLVTVRVVGLTSCIRQKRFTVKAVIEGVENALIQSIVVVLVLLGLGLASFGAALVIGAACSAAMTLRYSGWRPRRPDFAGLRGYLAETLRLTVGVSLTAFRTFAHVPLLTIIVGASAAGYFGYAYGFISVALMMVIAVSQPLLIGFATVRDAPRRSGALTLSLKSLSAMAGLFCAVLGGACAPIATVIFGAKWLPANPVIILLCVGVFPLVLSYPLTDLAVADQRSGDANRWAVCFVITIVAVGCPLAAWMGVRAYAAAFALASLLVLGLSWVRTSSLYTFSSDSAGFVIAAAIGAFGGVLAGVGAQHVVHASVWQLLSCCVLSASVFCALLLLLTRGRAYRDARGLWNLLSPKHAA
jgi:O-antigen/teichoic acid export membrane protein